MDDPPRNRILVVGRRGVGKMSLVHSILGSRIVPTTSASKSRPSSPLILPPTQVPPPLLEDSEDSIQLDTSQDNSFTRDMQTFPLSPLTSQSQYTQQAALPGLEGSQQNGGGGGSGGESFSLGEGRDTSSVFSSSFSFSSNASSLTAGEFPSYMLQTSTPLQSPRPLHSQQQQQQSQLLQQHQHQQPQFQSPPSLSLQSPHPQQTQSSQRHLSQRRPRLDHSGVTIPWTIDTKYYSVDVVFYIEETQAGSSLDLERMIEDGQLDELGSAVEAIIFCFTKNDLNTFRDIKPWLLFIERHDPSITLCVATDAPAHFEEFLSPSQKPTLALESSQPYPDDNDEFSNIEDYDDWCLANGLEYIDLQDGAFSDEFTNPDEHVGLARILEALAAHMWDGLKRKSTKKREEHGRTMMLSMNGNDEDLMFLNGGGGGDGLWNDSMESGGAGSAHSYSGNYGLDGSDDDDEGDDEDDDDRAFYKALANLNLQHRASALQKELEQDEAEASAFANGTRGGGGFDFRDEGSNGVGSGGGPNAVDEYQFDSLDNGLLEDPFNSDGGDDLFGELRHGSFESSDWVLSQELEHENRNQEKKRKFEWEMNVVDSAARRRAVAITSEEDTSGGPLGDDIDDDDNVAHTGIEGSDDQTPDQSLEASISGTASSSRSESLFSQREFSNLQYRTTSTPKLDDASIAVFELSEDVDFEFQDYMTADDEVASQEFDLSSGSGRGLDLSASQDEHPKELTGQSQGLGLNLVQGQQESESGRLSQGQPQPQQQQQQQQQHQVANENYTHGQAFFDEVFANVNRDSVSRMHQALFSNIDQEDGMAQTLATLQGLREQGRSLPEKERRELAARVALSFGMQME